MGQVEKCCAVVGRSSLIIGLLAVFLTGACGSATPELDARDAATVDTTDVNSDGREPPDAQVDVSTDNHPEDVADAPVEDAEALVEDAADAPVVLDSDIAIDVAANASLDLAPVETSSDSPGEAQDARVRRPRIYLATANDMSGTFFVVSDLVVIDVVAGRATADATILGVTAMVRRNDTLLVARNQGYTRISVLDATTLAVMRTQLLPWDPAAAVFSSDGRYLYAAHDEGWISQVRVDDGVVTASLRVSFPNGASGNPVLHELALDRSETRLAATGLNNGSGSFVVQVNIASESLTLTDFWLSKPFPSSNCERFAGALVFNRAGTKLATFDNNCVAFDVYDLATRALDPMTSFLFERSFGTTILINTVADARGQFWATNTDSLYRTSEAPGGAKTIPIIGAGRLVTDTTGETVYLFHYDARINGVETIDLDTGAPTRLNWNLDLVRRYSAPALVLYDENEP